MKSLKSYPQGSGYYRVVSTDAAAVLRAAELSDAMSAFDNPNIHIWRELDDRENCTLDFEHDGQPRRLHIKRYRDGRAGDEASGITLLKKAGIDTVPLLAHGQLNDGRSFIITDDLVDFHDAEKLVQARTISFDKILDPTARVAARLHAGQLRHRDLYLCHFFIHPTTLDVRLIDPARVTRLPWIMKQRWIIKDLAQFRYSLIKIGESTTTWLKWLETYAKLRQINPAPLDRATDSKAASIARHDVRLQQKQPHRNISLDR